jgi:hypothetical protein
MYNLLIYDYLNNSTFIYNIKPVCEEKLYVLFDIILDELRENISFLNTHINFLHNHECEIYAYKNSLKKGWLWDNIKNEKYIIYKIKPIRCLKPLYNSEIKHNKESQTLDDNYVSKHEKEIQTITDNISNCYKNKDLNTQIILNDIPLELNEQKTSSYNSYNAYCTSSNITRNSSIDSSINLSSSNEYSLSSSINENSNSNKNVDWGQFSWNEEFKKELKNKLNLENFGLYKPNKNFKQD